MPPKVRVSRYPSPPRPPRWRVESCCFCASLRTGAFIVALVYIIIGVAEGILYMYSDSFHAPKSDNTTTARLVTYSNRKVTRSQRERHLFVALGGVFLGLLLFFAILEEAVFLMVVWLWLDLAAIIQYFILAGLVYGVKEFTRSIVGGFIEILAVILFSVLAIYGYLIVYSAYRYVSGKDDEEDALRRLKRLVFF